MNRSIDYGNLMHRAMRGLIQEVLAGVAKTGLPGKHHFFITFDTLHPDVELADWLADRYPTEMTIVIQHRYWDLIVADDHFSIGLSFNQMPSSLVIPYDAIVGFVDPAVNFALQFAPKDGEGPPPETPPETPPPEPQDEGSNVVTLDRFRRK